MTDSRRSYFISDLHLGQPETAANHETYRKVESFLETVGGTDALFIVGDFFDLYFEYRAAIPKQCLRGLRLFYRLAHQGTTIHYLAGNHDAWAGDFLSKEFGIRLYATDSRFEVCGRKILLSHGDGHSHLDRRYRWVKAVLRNPFNKFLYRWLHPDIGIPLANRLSHASKRRDRYYEKYVGDESFFPWLEQEFKSGTDIVMMGHHHIPRVEAFPGDKLYINLGDWIQHYTYAILDKEGVRLERWEK